MQPNSYYGGGSSFNQYTNYSQSRRNIRKILLIASAIILLLVAALGILVASSEENQGSGISNKLISYISLGNGNDSYELLSQEAKIAISKEEWVRFVVANKSNMSNLDSLKLAYQQNLDENKVEEAYNIGTTGSIYRVVVAVNKKTNQIDSVSINKTSL